MAPARHLIPAIVLSTNALWGATYASAHEALSTDGQQARSALDFSIIIPAVLRIVENSHPPSLPPADAQNSRIPVMQRIVLVSTLRRGFCMDLQLTQHLLTDWQLQVNGSTGVRIEASAGGYRLCMRRAGRHELALQHNFRLKEVARESPPATFNWPVNVSLASP